MASVFSTSNALRSVQNDKSGAPLTVVNTSHDLVQKQVTALGLLGGQNTRIYHDRTRFRGTNAPKDILNYIKSFQGLATVYITTFGSVYIIAFASGCHFGTFERFEEYPHEFNLRSIVHYNDFDHPIVSVLRYDDPYVIDPDLSRVPLWLPRGS